MSNNVKDIYYDLIGQPLRSRPDYRERDFIEERKDEMKVTAATKRLARLLLGEGKEDLKLKILEWINKNPNPPDKKFHALAESMGMEPDKLEEVAYELVTIYAKFVNNGRAKEKGITEKDVDPKELEMGIKVEMEHTKDKDTAKRIAIDHLAEIKNYYTLLKKMESDAGVKE